MNRINKTTSTGQLISAIESLELIRQMPFVTTQASLLTGTTELQKQFTERLASCLCTGDAVLTGEEQYLCQTNQKIAAIKAVRTRLSIGISEAKSKVDQWMKEKGIDPFGARR